MSDEIVKARYTGNPASMRLDSGGEDLGQEIELLPRHHYDLPRSVVQDRDDFVIIEQEDDVADDDHREAREAKEKAAGATDTRPTSKSRPKDTERATDHAPREEG